MRMVASVSNRLKLELERLLMRGPLSRLAVIAGFVALVSLSAGLFVYATTGQFSTVSAAIWWAFLRLTDPGYLGDDQGTMLRVVSTIVTVAGYVLFLGALVAIMTQWLNSTIARLDRGLTPISRKNHVVVLGWSLRSAAVVEDLLQSDRRVRRFLDALGAGSLHVVILAEEVGPALVQELRDRLGPLWSARRITLRTGTPLRPYDLQRVDFLNAAAILMPGRDTPSSDAAGPDGVAIKALLSTAAASRELAQTSMPLMVAELSDDRAIPIAHRAYGGPIEVVASDLLVARLLAQSLRHPGLSTVFDEVLTRGGQSLYLRRLPELVGRTVEEVRRRFPRALFLGMVRGEGEALRPLLDPASAVTIDAADHLVLLAAQYHDTYPREPRAVVSPNREAVTCSSGDEALDGPRILVLGWSRSTAAMIQELDALSEQETEVDVFSSVPETERRAAIDRRGGALEHIALRLLTGDLTSPTDIERLEPERYDRIVLLASERYASEAESDARTLMAYLLVRARIDGAAAATSVLVELNDSENAPLVESRDEVVASPAIQAHVLTQVALRRELRVVLDELFGPGGATISLRGASGCGLQPGEQPFARVEEALWARDEIALGVRVRREMRLAPLRDEMIDLREDDAVIVLTPS